LDQILVQSGAGGGGGGGGGGRGASETVNSGVKSKLSIRRPEGGVFFRKLEKPESKLDLVYVRSLANSVQNKTGSNWSFGSRL
jgi:hypothetical protein